MARRASGGCASRRAARTAAATTARARATPAGRRRRARRSRAPAAARATAAACPTASARATRGGPPKPTARSRATAAPTAARRTAAASTARATAAPAGWGGVRRPHRRLPRVVQPQRAVRQGGVRVLPRLLGARVRRLLPAQLLGARAVHAVPPVRLRHRLWRPRLLGRLPQPLLGARRVRRRRVRLPRGLRRRGLLARRRADPPLDARLRAARAAPLALAVVVAVVVVVVAFLWAYLRNLCDGKSGTDAIPLYDYMIETWSGAGVYEPTWVKTQVVPPPRFAGDA